MHAQESELIRRSGLVLGENLFRVDLPRVARAMESHPWVESALLTRRLPGTLVVNIEEHHPAALVQLGEKSMYVLDEEGRLFKRAVPEDRLDLPVVTGLSREAWAERKPELQLRLFGALHLLDTWRASGFPVASVCFLGARANRLLDADGREPSFETVLKVMYGAGYRGDVYPAPWMWESAPTAMFPRYPFPDSLKRVCEGGY